MRLPNQVAIWVWLAFAGPILAVDANVKQAAQPETWDVRYAQIENQQPEWTAAGNIPAYTITYPDNGREVFIDSAGNPDYRGVVLLGKRFRVPETLEGLPASLKFNIDFQAWNETPNRTCGVYFYLMTAEVFEQYPPDAAVAKLPNLPWFSQQGWRESNRDVLAQETLHNGTDDMERWQAWRSPDMAPHLRNQLGKELVAVFAFQAPHQGALQWGKFRHFQREEIDERAMWQDFLRTAVNLNGPEMQPVRVALDAHDVEGACMAFVEHMKTRTKPVLPHLPMTADEEMMKKADELVCRYFAYYGSKPVQWGETPQWNANPPNYEQWTIGNNRHAYWKDLGRAYAQSGDEKYAREYVSQVVDFQKRYPFLIGDKDLLFIDGPIVSFSRINLSLNSGARMADGWWPAYQYFLNSPSLGAAEHMWIWKGFYEHAVYLADPRVFHSDSNWGSWEASGLYKCGVMMPEFKDSARWMQIAEERLKLLKNTLVYPDGSPKEISIGYHLANAGFFKGALELANVNGLPLDPELKQAVEEMYEVVMFSSRPGFGSIGFGDAIWSASGVVDAAKQVTDLFPERKDFQFFASAGEEGSPPAFASWMSPWAGWYCMRSGWTPEDRYLVLDAGPIGTSHFHADKLGIVVNIGKQMVLHETNSHAYDGSPMLDYVRGSWAHNTVIVDEKIQRSHGMRNFFETTAPLDNRWLSNENFDFAEGTYDLGYAAPDKPMSDVTHHREILFVKPDYWIVVDTMIPRDDIEHDYCALFHLSPGELVADHTTNQVSTEWEDGAFQILPLQPNKVDLTVVKGQMEPYLLGWIPTGGQTKRPSPVAVYNWKALGPTTMAWALVPRQTDRNWAVNNIELSEFTAGGAIRAVIHRPGGDAHLQRVPAADNSPRGNWSYVEKDAAGRETMRFEVSQ